MSLRELKDKYNKQLARLNILSSRHLQLHNEAQSTTKIEHIILDFIK